MEFVEDSRMKFCSREEECHAGVLQVLWPSVLLTTNASRRLTHNIYVFMCRGACMCMCQCAREVKFQHLSNLRLVTTEFMWKLVPTGAEHLSPNILNTGRGVLHLRRKIFGWERNMLFIVDGICTVLLANETGKLWLLATAVSRCMLYMQLEIASTQMSSLKNTRIGGH